MTLAQTFNIEVSYLVIGKNIQEVIHKTVELPENVTDAIRINLNRAIQEGIKREYWERKRIDVNVYARSRSFQD